MTKLTYPFKTMRITQSYTGTTSHLPHTTGSPCDYPLDEGEKDGGRSPMYAPCDLKVVKIYGVGNRGTNTLWVTSTEVVQFADSTTDYITICITHPNDSDIGKLKVGDIIKKGNIICYEGTDGATGNHIHFSQGTGKLSGNGWISNSKGKWVITTTGKAKRPEDTYFIDKSFTTVVNDRGLNWKDLSKAKTIKIEKYTKGNYEVTTAVLKVRSGAGQAYAAKHFSELTDSAKAKIKKIAKKEVDGYVQGLQFTCSEVKEVGDYHWGRTPSGWVALEYCKKI